MFIVWSVLAIMIYFLPSIVARVLLENWQEVYDHNLMYSWTGVGYLSSWCMIIDSLLRG
jgi:hypothetical protein